MLGRVGVIVATAIVAAAVGACGKSGLKSADDFARYVGDVLSGKSAYGVKVADDAAQGVKLGVQDAGALERFQGAVESVSPAACAMAGVAKDVLKPDSGLLSTSVTPIPGGTDQIFNAGRQSGLLSIQATTATNALLEMTPFTLASLADVACKVRDSGGGL